MSSGGGGVICRLPDASLFSRDAPALQRRSPLSGDEHRAVPRESYGYSLRPEHPFAAEIKSLDQEEVSRGHEFAKMALESVVLLMVLTRKTIVWRCL